MRLVFFIYRNVEWMVFHFLLGGTFVFGVFYLKSASNLNGNLNCSKELEHYAS